MNRIIRHFYFANNGFLRHESISSENVLLNMPMFMALSMNRPSLALTLWAAFSFSFLVKMSWKHNFYTEPSRCLFSLDLCFWISLQNWRLAGSPRLFLTCPLHWQVITCASTVIIADSHLSLVLFSSQLLSGQHFWNYAAWAPESLLFIQVTQALRLKMVYTDVWTTNPPPENTFLSLTFLLAVIET